MSTPVGIKAKIALVLFGLLIGIGTLQIALKLFFSVPKGSQFESLNDLRRAILVDDGKPDEARKVSSDGTVDESSQRHTLRGIIFPHESDEIIYELIPNLETKFMRAALKTNSCGMRDVEIPIAKPEGEFRIALLGDSFAFGWGVEHEESFGALLEDNLNRRAPEGQHFRVMNFGVPGYSTFQEVAHFAESALDFKPDAVLVFFVENDFGMPFFIKDIYNPGSILDAVSFARRSWQGNDEKIGEQVAELTSFDPNRALLKLIEHCSKHGVDMFFTINPRKNAPELKRKLWVLKQHPEISYLDLRPAFTEFVERRNIPDEQLTLSFDPHPSPLRHQIYADILTPYFLRFVRDK